MTFKIATVNFIFTSIVFIFTFVFTSELVFAYQEKPAPWRVSARKAKIKNPIPIDEASVSMGKEIYQRECQECHGTNGNGDGPEAAKLDKMVKDFAEDGMWAQTDGAIYWKIRTGRRPMPGFKKLLSKEEIWHVINYVRHDFEPEK
ncbi:c-type cytochrome [Thalassomonas actiniarum]|uniref:Cytochrome c n=1 Tax=Thalassomonas actiniarum TaxID=485447 RepID=A0AAF0C3K2_9GAMM|nr:cytochrome c [Thalassomonas actiniarum]WDE01287.1 cytochrome c [Thalassomonas actiniarum]